MQFADPTNDIAFRKIFGDSDRRKSLISFINAVLDLPNGQIVRDVEIMDPQQLPLIAQGKSTVIDVKAKTEDGSVFIVEMQVAKPAAFHKRALYYSARAYSGQIQSGSDYEKLAPVYFIGILGFSVEEDKDYLSRYRVQNVKTGKTSFEDVSFHLIQLPKFDKGEDELESITDRWCYFMKNAKNLEMIPKDVEDEGLKAAWETARKETWSEVDWDLYIRAGMWMQDQIGVVKQAKIDGLSEGERIGIEKGKRDGLVEGERIGAEKGKRDGLVEGERIGVEKGKAEGLIEGELKGKKEIAKNLKTAGIDSETIAKTTGLSAEEIDRL